MKSESDWNRTFLIWALISLALHLVASMRSIGWYHADEHFQILEFLTVKLGLSTAEGLAWEFPARVRPFLQVWIYWLWTKPLLLAGVDSAMVFSGVIRAGSAVIGWISTIYLARCIPIIIQSPFLRHAALILVTTSSLTLFLHVRTSAENLSASFLSIAAALIVLHLAKANKLPARVSLWIGVLFGLSFHCKYQMGLMIFGAGMWLVFYRHITLRAVGAMVGGFAAVSLIAWFTEIWGYGEMTFAPWTYFSVQVLGGKAASFGKQPWNEYLILTNQAAGYLLGIAIMVALVLGFATERKHLFSWIVIPYIAAHFLLERKLLRYMFPIFPFIPFFIFMVIEQAKFQSKTIFWIGHGVLGLGFIINALGVLKVTTIYESPNVAASEWIHHNFRGATTIQWINFSSYGSPELDVKFYVRPDYQILGPTQPPPSHTFIQMYVRASTEKARIEPHCELLKSFENPKFWTLFERWIPALGRRTYAADVKSCTM